MVAVFWTIIALAAFVILGYGVLMIVIERLLGPQRRPLAVPLSVTVLIAAHNEERFIAEKLRNVLEQDVGDHSVRVVVASDGSTDATADVVRSFGDPRVSLIEVRDHLGKIPTMNRALEGIGDDIVIFSDANSHLVEGALEALLAWFADPDVGGVCGAPDVCKRDSGWLGSAERLYWRYDNRLKLAESRLGGAVSAQGSLYAMRRELIGVIPDSVSDDFFISTGAVAAGKRLVFEPAAVTVEPVSNNTRDEFFRRVRSTERGWRGLLMRRGLLNPWRTGFYAVELLFHKVLRRMTPVMLVAILALSIALAGDHWFFALLLLGQVIFYAIAALALLWPDVRQWPGFALVFFFVETQIAMAWGLVRVALGKHSRRWKPARDVATSTG